MNEEEGLDNRAFDHALGPAVSAPECYLVAGETGDRPTLDGNIARRRDVPSGIIWDQELIGFGLRVRNTGYKSWIVKYRERRIQRFVTLGNAAKVDAQTARAKALAFPRGKAMGEFGPPPTPALDPRTILNYIPSMEYRT